MNLLSYVQARYFVPSLITLGALVTGAGLYLAPFSTTAAGATAMGCGGVIVAGINCSAGEPVPVQCGAEQMAYQYNDQDSFQCPTARTGGYYWSGNKGYCQTDPACSACVPNSGCAANTCSTGTCSDSCGNVYAGTKNCTAPPLTCQSYGYNYGTLGCCYNNADHSDDACTPDVCPATPGKQTSSSECNCTDTPSGPGCGPTQPIDVCLTTPGNQTSSSECNCTDNPSGPGCTPTEPIDVCPTTLGIQTSTSQCNCTDNPSGYGCYVPTPTCADYGQLGTYPYCYPAPTPTCADSGQLGTYPYCYAAPTCVAHQGQYCTASNSCGMSNGGAYQCDGSCSASAPPESSCPAAAAPSISCTVNNTNPTVGQTVTYTAQIANGATPPYTWYTSSGGYFGVNSTASRTFNAPGAYDMQVKADYVSYTTCPFVTVGANACTDTGSASIDANKTRVPSGSSVTLSWTASNASAACTISGPGVNQSSSPSACAVSGSATTPAITTQATYTISCPNGVTDSVIVNVLPKIEEF